jgi:hypothetical protein
MLIAVIVASVGLSALGLCLTVRATRLGRYDAHRLAMATVIAGIPALVMIAAMYWTRGR